MKLPRRLFLSFVTAMTLSGLCAVTAHAAPEFESSFETASEKAKAENKPLIVIFSATWCPPCQMMKRMVYPSDEIQPYHDKFIWAYLDADEEENRSLMMKYGVQGIPHIALHTAEGEVTSQLRGAMGPDQLAKELSEALQPAG